MSQYLTLCCEKKGETGKLFRKMVGTFRSPYLATILEIVNVLYYQCVLYLFIVKTHRILWKKRGHFCMSKKFHLFQNVTYCNNGLVFQFVTWYKLEVGRYEIFWFWYPFLLNRFLVACARHKNHNEFLCLAKKIMISELPLGEYIVRQNNMDRGRQYGDNNKIQSLQRVLLTSKVSVPIYQLFTVGS